MNLFAEMDIAEEVLHGVSFDADKEHHLVFPYIQAVTSL